MIFNPNQRNVIISAIIVVILLFAGVLVWFWNPWGTDLTKKDVTPTQQDTKLLEDDEDSEDDEDDEDDTEEMKVEEEPEEELDELKKELKEISEPVSGRKSRVIREIVVVGNSRVLSRAIIAHVNLQISTEVTDADLAEAMGRVFDSGYFDTVEISLNENGVLEVLVKEKPIVRNVDIRNVKSEENLILSTRLQVKPRQTFDESNLQKDISAMEQAFRVSGQFNTDVKAKVIELPGNRVDVEYIVNKKRHPLIRDIEIIGNQSIQDSVLRSIIPAREQSWIPWMAKSFLTPDLLNTSSEIISSYYSKFGFPYATVSSIVAEFDRVSDSFLLTFVLDEGGNYKFGDAEIKFEDGREIFLPEEERKEIVDSFIKKGNFYSSDQVKFVESVVRGALENFGYSNISLEVTAKPDHQNMIMNLDFIVKDMQRKYIRRVDIIGNTTSSDYIVLRRLEFSPGDIYDASNIQASISNLRSSGNFKEVSIVTTNVMPDTVDLEVRVEPLKYKIGNVQMKISADKDSIGHTLVLVNKNFLSTGRTILLEVKLPFGGKFRDEEGKISGASLFEKYTHPDLKKLSVSFTGVDSLSIPNVLTILSSSYSKESESDIFVFKLNRNQEKTNNWKDLFKLGFKFILDDSFFGMSHHFYYNYNRTNIYVGDDVTQKIYCNISIGDGDERKSGFLLASSKNSCRSVGGTPIDPDDYPLDIRKILTEFWGDEEYEGFLAVTDVFGNAPGLNHRSTIGWVFNFGKTLGASEDPVVLTFSGDVSYTGFLFGSEHIVKTEFVSTLTKNLSNFLDLKVDFNAGLVVGLNNVVPYDMRYTIGGSSFPGFSSDGIAPRLKISDVLGGGDDTEYKHVGGNAFYKFKIGIHTPLFFPKEYHVDFSINLNMGSAFMVDPRIKKAYPDGIETDSIFPRISLSVEASWDGPLGNLTVGYGWSIKYMDKDEKTHWIFNIGASI